MVNFKQFVSWLDKHEFKPSFDVYSDRLEESAKRNKTKPSAFTRCTHYIITRKGKFHSFLVDYKPTPNEVNRIMSHPKFSGFDKIGSIEICTHCDVIRVTSNKPLNVKKYIKK